VRPALAGSTEDPAAVAASDRRVLPVDLAGTRAPRS
jgi:hypothetical protein